MMIFLMPPVIMQWDLITRKFEMQYIFNIDNLDKLVYSDCSLMMKLNSDSTLLVVFCEANDRKSAIYVYSTKCGRMVATSRYLICKNFYKYKSKDY